MTDEESIRSKYVRLGTEFKRLREKHRLTKESLKESTEQVAAFEKKLRDTEIHLRNLEDEKGSLRFRNEYLAKQTAFLQEQLSSASSRDGRPRKLSTSDGALERALHECSILHDQLVSQSAKFLARIAELEDVQSNRKASQGVSISVQTSCLPVASSCTHSSSSVDATSSSLDALCLGNTDSEEAGSLNTSASFSRLPNSVKIPPLKDETIFIPKLPNDISTEVSTKERLLLDRIAQLESQLADVSLRNRIETRRSQLAKDISTTAQNDATSTATVAEENSPLVQHFRNELACRNQHLAVYAGRVADSYEEIRNLHEHMKAASQELARQRRLLSVAKSKTDALNEELEGTKASAARQLQDMALHLAHLTDEIHELQQRDSMNGSPASKNADRRRPHSQTHEKVNSFFNSILK